MNNSLCRIKIKVDNIEVELEGQKKFVLDQKAKFKNFFLWFEQQYKISTSEIDNNNLQSQKDVINLGYILNQDFSFWQKVITRDTDEIVSYLIGGYYLQRKNKENYFTTKDVFSLLYKHGILIENVVLCESHNLKFKNIIKIGRSNKNTKYRLSELSEKTLLELLESYFK